MSISIKNTTDQQLWCSVIHNVFALQLLQHSRDYILHHPELLIAQSASGKAVSGKTHETPHSNKGSWKSLTQSSLFCLKRCFSFRLLSSEYPANTTVKKTWFCTHSFSSWGDATRLTVNSCSCSSSFASCLPLVSGLIWSVPIFSVVLRTKLETLQVRSSNI